MQPNDFIQWLRGFIEGVHDFNVTPKQWDDIKDKLNTVQHSEKGTRYTLDSSNWNTTTTNNYADVTYKTDVPTTNTI